MLSRRQLFKSTASALAVTILPLDMMCAQASKDVMLGWKSWRTAKVLNENWIRAIRHAKG